MWCMSTGRLLGGRRAVREESGAGEEEDAVEGVGDDRESSSTCVKIKPNLDWDVCQAGNQSFSYARNQITLCRTELY